MGRAKKATFPKVSIHKGKGRARLRFGQRDIWLGKAGSREAENNRLRVHAAWVEAGGKLPDDFTLVEDSPVIPIPARKSPTLVVTSGLLVGDLLAEALQEVGGGKTKAQLRDVSTWDRLKAAAKALEPYARLPAIQFGPRALGEISRRLSTSPMANLLHGKRVRPTRTHVRAVVETIIGIFADAVSREDLPPERLVALKSLRKLPGIEEAREPGVRTPVPVDDFEATLPLLPPVVADLLRFTWATACRPGEACEITRAEVDTTATPWVWTPRKHKTRHHGFARVIAVGPRGREILTRWWAGKGDNDPVFDRGDMVGGSDIVPMRALRTDQRAFDSQDLRRRVAKACIAAGVARWSPYQIRHAALTELREVGGRDVAQAQAGHRNGSMTERYARPAATLQAAAVEAVG